MNLIDPRAQDGAEKEEPSKKAKGGNLGGESRPDSLLEWLL